MKKIIILFFVLISQLNYSQNKSIIANYTYINKGLNEISIAELYINGNESLTIFRKKDSTSKKNSFDEDDGSFNINIDGRDKIGKRVYKNLKENKVVFRDVYSKEGKLRPCIVEEKLTYFAWNFGNATEVKKVGKYICNLAKVEFRGRQYDVWYTTEIPIRHGPWKFHGLPGMIVEIKSKDGNIHFLLNEIKESNSIFNNHIVKPTNGDKILFKDYVMARKESVNDFIKRLKSKLPRGAKIKINSSQGDYNIEKAFEEEN